MQTEKIIKQIAIVIIAHTVLIVVNSYVHQKIDLLSQITIYMPIILLLSLTPLAAVLFMLKQSARQGAIILLGTLPAEIIYNSLTRFKAEAPFTINEVDLLWKIIYEISFGLTLTLEAIAFWLTLKVMREIHKQLNSHSNKNVNIEK